MLPPEKDLHNLFMPDPKPKEKKKAINSKAKGKGFEGDVAKKLTKALEPYIFKRVIFSGAILGGKNAANMGHYSEALANMFVGDVVCVNDNDFDKTFRFNVECKFYKTPETLDNFLGVVNSNIPKWFEESVVDAKKVNKTPLLIVKWNRSSIYCFIEGDGYLPHVDMTWVPHVTFSNFELKAFLLDDALKDTGWWFTKKDKT